MLTSLTIQTSYSSFHINFKLSLKISFKLGFKLGALIVEFQTPSLELTALKAVNPIIYLHKDW